MQIFTLPRTARVARLFALVLLLVADQTAAQEPAVVLRGSWAAAASSGLTVRGRWSAQPHPDVAGAAYGSWTVDDRGRVVMEGTWAAEKRRNAWSGTWSARTSTGRSYSGSWEAALQIPADGTLMDMLRQAQQEQIAGTWRYGGLTGNWWIQGTAR